MKNKKILFVVGIALACIILIFLIIKYFTKNTEEIITEITPGEEMTEIQERQTIISLYYINIETNTLVPEARVIDVKDLLENPYKTLLENLMLESKNERLKSSIPEGTKINSINYEKGIIEIDLSEEFLNSSGTNAIF